MLNKLTLRFDDHEAVLLQLRHEVIMSLHWSHSVHLRFTFTIRLGRCWELNLFLLGRRYLPNTWCEHHCNCKRLTAKTFAQKKP